jgi:hypothetical protein
VGYFGFLFLFLGTWLFGHRDLLGSNNLSADAYKALVKLSGI